MSLIDEKNATQKPLKERVLDLFDELVAIERDRKELDEEMVENGVHDAADYHAMGRRLRELSSRSVAAQDEIVKLARACAGGAT